MLRIGVDIGGTFTDFDSSLGNVGPQVVDVASKEKLRRRAKRTKKNASSHKKNKLGFVNTSRRVGMQEEMSGCEDAPESEACDAPAATIDTKLELIEGTATMMRMK